MFLRLNVSVPAGQRHCDGIEHKQSKDLQMCSQLVYAHNPVNYAIILLEYSDLRPSSRGLL